MDFKVQVEKRDLLLKLLKLPFPCYRGIKIRENFDGSLVIKRGPNARL